MDGRQAVRLIQALLLVALATGPVEAADFSGAADYPLVPRYEDSEIIKYETEAFTDYRLLTAPAKNYGGLAKNLEATTPLEGKLMRITYRAPAQRSSLEVFKNYETSLREGGFETTFRCAKEACGGRNFNHAAAPKHYYLGFGEYHADQRYLAAKLTRPEGDVYLALYVVLNKSGGGPDKDRVLIQLDALEVKPMESRMVFVDAAAIQRDLAADGRVAIYGIQFDFDKDTIRAESKPQLAEIAKLLSEAPELKVLIVGHTDAKGGFDYNLDLSRRRAMSVVEALAGGHGVDRERLRPVGVGMAAPVATNRSEEGRGRNRRVEIVELVR
jgi:outer membrane protein OmpA-like peptidoglycan-associated protein